jgi:hypothetical protein
MEETTDQAVTGSVQPGDRPRIPTIEKTLASRVDRVVNRPGGLDPPPRALAALTHLFIDMATGRLGQLLHSRPGCTESEAVAGALGLIQPHAARVAYWIPNACEIVHGHLTAKLAEWKARRPAPKADEAAQAGPQATRRGYKREVRAYMEKKGLSTIPEAAQALAVGVDTLKSIMTSRGKKRYSDGTLQGVLKKIGCTGT